MALGCWPHCPSHFFHCFVALKLARGAWVSGSESCTYTPFCDLILNHLEAKLDEARDKSIIRHVL
ncbi:hypothetical protein Scep_007168 [Stephania cephalantha]|uniref:Uncharacterized protein n=1 Tax=Stephania cephalantha TaxID=152367 RepID=A0AAP0K9I2_9MAGN